MYLFTEMIKKKNSAKLSKNRKTYYVHELCIISLVPFCIVWFFFKFYKQLFVYNLYINQTINEQKLAYKILAGTHLCDNPANSA